MNFQHVNTQLRANIGKQPKVLEGVREELKKSLNHSLVLLSYQIILPCLAICLGNKKSGYVPVMLCGGFLVKQNEKCVMHAFQLDGGVAVSCSVILKVKEQKVLTISVKLGHNWCHI